MIITVIYLTAAIVLLAGASLASLSLVYVLAKPKKKK